VSASEAIAGPAAAARADVRTGSLLGCLVIVARHRGVQLSAQQLVHDQLLQSDQLSSDELVHVAMGCGLRATAATLDWEDLAAAQEALPAIVRFADGSAMVLLRADAQSQPARVVLQDPDLHEGAVLTLDKARFLSAWTGEVILIKRDHRLRDEDQPFGFSLVLGQVLRDRRIARDVAIAAMALALLAVAPILFWRLLVDRVLYYGSLNTLAVLCATMVVLLAFETAFTYLRRYLVLQVSARVDAKLSIYIFNKVLALPVEFFERTWTGIIARDIGEFWKIREFISGQLFGTVLDALVLLVFLPIMFFFSPLLTGCVLFMCALICGWIVYRLPALQRKAALTFAAEGAKGAHLVQALNGIRTVKSLALDARQRQQWDVLVAKSARLRLDEGLAANVIQTVVRPLERVMTSGVIALAVYLAISTGSQVYVGALIAFMMLTQRVAQPLVELSQLIQKYDEVRLAVRVIARLVNQPPEEGRSAFGIRTPLVGRIDFLQVRFRYQGTVTPALDEATFSIPEGTIFGIMGRSGSGKTTVTRLMQLLHSNYEGLIKIDGNDLREFDVDHLRSSIGVVLQENFLFTGTIRETIAATKPDATFEQVVAAARLAGAEEFIERLPRGYETHIYEGSPNLSGGQRQRLAIARALISDPAILILDEATSALDAESEAIVNANLMRIARGRTLIIISHRLSSLVCADAILVLERGRVYDIGRHEDLLARCDIYSMLWHQQHRHLLPRSPHELVSLPPGSAV
jgi:subfamily B ATP-binding cassette protein HlyB/CyaB